jgi:hypothetical protein
MDRACVASQMSPYSFSVAGENGVRGSFCTAAILSRHVRFGSKADVTLLNFDVRFKPRNVRFVPKADISHSRNSIPFFAANARKSTVGLCTYLAEQESVQRG